MSDSIRRYENGATTQTGGITVNTPYEDKDKGITIDDFLQLMIAQMKNVDFMGEGGGTDSGQMVSQLAQISAMQEMQQLAYYSKSNYVMSMVGKEATVASLGIGGSVDKQVGIVEKITMDNNEFLVYVNGKGYKLNEIMSVNNPGSVTDDGLDKISKSAVIITSYDDVTGSIRWDKPPVSDESLTKLDYTVYYSTDRNMDTISDVKKNGKIAGEANQKGVYEADIEGLEPGKTYYVNVVVTTADGKQYIYQKSSFRTDGTDSGDDSEES